MRPEEAKAVVEAETWRHLRAAGWAPVVGRVQVFRRDGCLFEVWVCHRVGCYEIATAQEALDHKLYLGSLNGDAVTDDDWRGLAASLGYKAAKQAAELFAKPPGNADDDHP